MTLDSYGLSKEDYLEIFYEKSVLALEAFGTFTLAAKDNDIKLELLGEKIMWGLFQDICYASDEEARMIQQEKNPDEIKKRQWPTYKTTTTLDIK